MKYLILFLLVPTVFASTECVEQNLKQQFCEDPHKLICEGADFKGKTKPVIDQITEKSIRAVYRKYQPLLEKHGIFLKKPRDLFSFDYTLLNSCISSEVDEGSCVQSIVGQNEDVIPTRKKLIDQVTTERLRSIDEQSEFLDIQLNYIMEKIKSDIISSLRTLYPQKMTKIKERLDKIVLITHFSVGKSPNPLIKRFGQKVYDTLLRNFTKFCHRRLTKVNGWAINRTSTPFIVICPRVYMNGPTMDDPMENFSRLYTILSHELGHQLYHVGLKLPLNKDFKQLLQCYVKNVPNEIESYYSFGKKK